MTRPQDKGGFGAADYRMSFTAAGLLLNESIQVARMHVSNEPWQKTLEQACTSGSGQLPKATSNRRVLREITIRLAALSDDERTYLIEAADRSDQQALLWLACCRTYRFIREFSVEVIRDRYLSYQLDLPLEAFDIFFEAKAEWNEGLADLSKSTRLKLRQILFRMMREAAVISTDESIQTAHLSLRLKTMIQENDPKELLFFPGLEAGV